MREILFKAKRVDNGEWCYGVPLVEGWSKTTYIASYEYSSLAFVQQIEVIPETLCEFTGLYDNNGNRIWENDIVNVSRPMGFNYIGTVLFDTAKFIVRYKGRKGDTILGEKEKVSGMGYGFEHTLEYEVMGNIHDNKLEDFESED